MNKLNELLTHKDFELPFQELFQIIHNFINPIKAIRLNNSHYNPHDLISYSTQLNGKNLIDLRNDILKGNLRNNGCSILNYK